MIPTLLVLSMNTLSKKHNSEPYMQAVTTAAMAVMMAVIVVTAMQK